MKRILVPVALSEDTTSLINHACIIGRAWDAQINLLHCYPLQTYARMYDFKGEDYDRGIRRLLKKAWDEGSSKEASASRRFLTYKGSLSGFLEKESARFDLVLMNRKTSDGSFFGRWLSEKVFYLASRAACPVLVSSEKDLFDFKNMTTIWHIKRSDHLRDLDRRTLSTLKIDPANIMVKSIGQQAFVSEFWQRIVSFAQSRDGTYLEGIEDCLTREHLDLIIVSRARRGLLESLIKDRAFQIVTSFEVPILVI